MHCISCESAFERFDSAGTRVVDSLTGIAFGEVRTNT
jgi:hypothetical protein